MNQRILDQASVYTDLTAVHQLRSKTVGKDEAIHAAAKQFESFLTNMMLKSMRQVNAVFEEGNPFHDSASRVYRDMLDQQLSLNMTQVRHSGLAEMLARQLGAGRDPASRDGAEADPESGLSELDRTTLSEVRRHRGGPTGVTLPLPARTEPPSARAPAAAPTASTPTHFETPEAYIDAVYPAAARVASQLGVDPAVLVAQSALETGWGRHMIQSPDGRPSHNLFGIKADARWQGPSVEVQTTEYVGGKPVREQAAFRAYASFEDSFSDYLAFIRGQSRYADAVAQASDPAAYTESLQAAGYATDPAYADKIQRIFGSELMQRARLAWHSRQEADDA